MAAAKKKISGYIKLQLPAGKANPAPPVGPALGQHGVNIMQFCKDFSSRSAKFGDAIIPVVITVHSDRTYSFVMKQPPAGVLIKKACGLPTAKKRAPARRSQTRSVGQLTWDQVRGSPRRRCRT
jgi:large subunit ribosomal protein L11